MVAIIHLIRNGYERVQTIKMHDISYKRLMKRLAGLHADLAIVDGEITEAEEKMLNMFITYRVVHPYGLVLFNPFHYKNKLCIGSLRWDP